MKIQYRLLTLLAIISFFPSFAMDYGLRFKAHSMPGSQRTSLSLGKENEFKFSKELAVDFDMSFYENLHFGQICAIILDDGQTISLVSTVDDNNSYHPAILIDEKLNPVPVDFIAPQNNPARPRITLDKNNNTVVFKFNDDSYVFPADLSKANVAKIIFGETERQATIAPFEMKDVRVFIDKKNTHQWELGQHLDETTLDVISSSPAVAVNPSWIIDEHMKWTEILHFTTTGNTQTTFNPATSTFYILSDDLLRIFDAQKKTMKEIPLSEDGRVMKFSNYLAYDSVSNSLLSYHLKDRITSRLDLNTMTWSGAQATEDEPVYYNHAFASDGKTAYTFGGYGFYLFHNSAFKINLQTGEISQLQLSPLPEPRTSSAAAIVGDKLYIFGGFGNAIGKQEIPSSNYLDLWEYDLETLKGRKLWEAENETIGCAPSSSMYYSKRDNAFYMASTRNGGNLIKIYLDKPGYEIVSEPIHSKMDYRDCVFDLYRSDDERTFYLVMDKRIDMQTHDYAIYTITYPFSDSAIYTSLLKNHNPNNTPLSPSLIYWLIAGIALAILVFGFVILRRRNRKYQIPSSVSSEEESANSTSSKSEIPATITHVQSVESAKLPADNVQPAQIAVENVQRSDTTNTDPEEISFLSRKDTLHFDRSKSAISLLGEFNIRNREGEDITSNFSSRLKDLLILLILESEKNPKGVRQQKIDEEIWNDKDERSAKNNRNVYMRKLRLLLENVGDIEIIYDKGYYSIKNKNVFIDYHEAMERFRRLQMNEANNKQIIDETLELLLFGPLLPQTTYERLDKFKSEYSDESLNMLYKLFQYVKSTDKNNDRLIYHIAETISCHDALSEEALEIKCRVLAQRKMKGLAKKIYEQFAREYRNSFGEDFPRSFSDILG